METLAHIRSARFGAADVALVPSARRAPSPLVGRDGELRRLHDAALERPGVVLVDGPAGVGKTALLRRFVAGRHDVLWLSGEPAERDLPFALADQLQPRAGGPPTDVVTAGARLLEILVRGPVVLVLDDAPWADRGSLRALLYALRRVRSDAAVLVVLAARTDALHRLPGGLLRLVADARISLGALDRGGVRALARARAPALSQRALRRVEELSAGIPSHVVDLLDLWSVRGTVEVPAADAALVAASLRACSDDARRLVEAAAVLGPGATIHDLAVVGAVAAPAAGLDEAVGCELLAVDRRAVAFVLPLARAAVHEGLRPSRRAELHAAAAALRDQEGDDGAALLHRARAALLPDAALAGELEAAARRAGASGDWMAAADLLDEAAALSAAPAERERRFLDGVAALCDAGDLVAARALLKRVRGAACVARRELLLGRLALTHLDLAAAEDHLGRAWDAAASRDAELRTRIAGERARCACFRLDLRAQLTWARSALQTAPASGPATGSAARAVAVARALSGRLPEALALLDQAIGTDGAPSPGTEDLKSVRGRLRGVADDLAGAHADLGDAAARPSCAGAALALGRLALVEYSEGRWDEALAHAEEGLAASVERRDVAHSTVIRAPAVLVLAARGAWADADQHLRDMHAEQHGAELPRVCAALAGARLAAAKGDPEVVVDALGPVLALARREAIDEPGFWPWQGFYADALVELGRLAAAESFLTAHEARARRRGRSSMIGRLARSRARLEGARGDEALARAAFAQAVAVFRDVAMPFELAITELLLGEFLRRRRHRRAAVEVLASAREVLAGLGARPALERCERELEACGLSPRRADGPGAQGLTPRELTICRLVVAGMTNREIAAELIVSTKTVEVHLTRVYAKLEVGSRTELRARARRGELVLAAR